MDPNQIPQTPPTPTQAPPEPAQAPPPPPPPPPPPQIPQPSFGAAPAGLPPDAPNNPAPVPPAKKSGNMTMIYVAVGIVIVLAILAYFLVIKK